MKFHRIYAIILRQLFTFIHSFDRLTDAFYWPVLDITLWGLTSSYFRSIAPNTPPIIIVIVGGLILWIITYRAQYDISINILGEMWDKNLVNLFVSPLKFSEWITSLIIMGAIKASASILFASIFAFLLYKINIISYGFYLLPFIFLLLMTGWYIGFFVSSITLRYGTKVQTLAWTVPWIIAPFSAIYFPISALPQWAQKISYFVPTSYVFEGARQVINTKTLDWNYIYLSFGLNLLYLALSIFVLKKSFNAAMRKGLQSLF